MGAMALPVEQEKIKPSAAWYVVGTLLLVVSVVVPIVLIVLGVQAFQDEIERFDSVPADTGGELTLEAGDYTVYIEGPGVGTFSAFSANDVEIINPSGESEDLSPVSGDFTYNVDGEDGVAKLTFSADESGTYQIIPGDSTSVQANVNDITIGPGFGEVIGSGLPYWIAAGVIGFVAFLVGLIMLIVTGVKRGKQKRQRRLAAGGGYPAPPGYGSPPQQGYAPPAPGGYQPPPTSTF